MAEDLYRFSKKDDFKKYYPAYKGSAPLQRPYDGQTEYLKLLGFADKDYKLKEQ